MKRKPKDLPCCPACRRPLPPGGLHLPPIKRRIFDLVSHHGEISSEILHTAIWGSDPNGGASMSTLRVHIHQLNKMLAPKGFVIRSRTVGAEPGIYHFVAEAAE